MYGTQLRLGRGTMNSDAMMTQAWTSSEATGHAAADRHEHRRQNVGARGRWHSDWHLGPPPVTVNPSRTIIVTHWQLHRVTVRRRRPGHGASAAPQRPPGTHWPVVAALEVYQSAGIGAGGPL
jgi:hypothetical protein